MSAILAKKSERNTHLKQLTIKMANKKANCKDSVKKKTIEKETVQ